MAGCRGCGAASAYLCQCSWASSNCVTVVRERGYGIHLEPLLDEDEDNLVECNPSGFGMFLPRQIANPPTVRTFLSIDQPIPDNTSQVLFFNRTRYDTDTMHDNVTNMSRLTFHTPGVYICSLSVGWTGNDTGDRKIGIRRNTAEVIVQDERGSEQGDDFDQSTWTIDKFETGDFIEAIVAQNSGAALNILAQGNYTPEFAASYVAVG